jgi:putative phosphoribosyl transferase
VGRVGDVEVPAGGAQLEGTLVVPPDPRGIVVFAHGSGSGRLSRRNRAVARTLHEAGLGTLFMDLLTAREEAIDRRTAGLRFDVGMLGERVIDAIDWLLLDAAIGDVPPQLGRLPVGCFGASTCAAAALIASAERPARVGAVVSRGGRPDLAGGALQRVTAPTLLIVGSRDLEVVRLNEIARQRLPGESRLEIVAGAGHLFEEAGALEQVGRLARDWFAEHLVS